MKALKRLFLFLVLVLIFVVVASEAGGQEEATGFPEPLSKTEEKGIHERGAQILGFFLLLGGGRLRSDALAEETGQASRYNDPRGRR